MSSVKYIHHSEIDKQKWDDCIRNSAMGNIYCYSWYLDIVHPKWNALIMDNYSIVFPLTQSRKFGIQYLFTPIYGTQLGIIGTSNTTYKEEALFWKHFPLKIRAIDIHLNRENSYIPIKTNVFKREAQELQLNQSYENIFSKYNQNLKRIIKKNKQQVLIQESTNSSELISIFKKYVGFKIVELKEKDYATLKKLIEKGLSNTYFKIYNCYTIDGELIASCFFSYSHKRITYHKGGATELGKKIGATHILIDSILEKNQLSSSIFDFGGSSIDSIKKFNLSFGSQTYSYLNLKKSNFLINFSRKLKNKLKSL